MKYSKKDLILVAVTLLLPVHLLNWAVHFDRLTTFENCFVFIFSACWFWYNAMIATHNFIHTPFFKSEWMNRIYMFINSMNMNVPHIMFHFHHMQHHAHNNSLKDPSSTYTYGKNGEQEHWFKYCALAPYRKGTVEMFKMSIKKGKGGLLFSHISALGILYIILSLIDINFMITFLVLSYFSWFFCSMENYFEHYKAKSINDRYSNAVSFHGRLYNLFFFNVGFHQEHHLEPQTHWSKTDKVRRKYINKMTNSGAYISSAPPLMGLFSHEISN